MGMPCPSPGPASAEDDTTSTLGPLSSTSSSVRSLSPLRGSSPRHARPLSPTAARTLTISFFCAVLSALCAGSVTVFSLYGHIFQSRLRYSQFEVNGLASAASVAMYIPVPVLGYVCDRVGPAPLSLLSAVFFGGGYIAAGGLYRHAVQEGGGRGVYVEMVVSFVAIGVGTCSMYMSAVATCAKNFGKGKHRGLALAVPIAAFGLSGMWLSQVGSRVFYERLGDGLRGDVDVFRFFVFLGGLLLVVGLIGTWGLRVVDEEELIDEAVEELERSGLLDGSAFLTPGRMERGYGAVEESDPFEDMESAGILDPRKDPEEEEAARLKKKWVLNAETKRFLMDPTMWCFALGFFFMIGPGEAFINNLGTIIKTLYPPTLHQIGEPTSAATHVSIVGITSTVVRLLTGSLTDWLAPSPQTRHVQITSTASLLQRGGFSVSRVAFLLFYAVVLSIGLVALASGFIQNHGERFWIVSGLVGAGYGAVFSLTPIIITVIWGVENFATNWGIVAMFPALGATSWGLIYSWVYQAGAKAAAGRTDDGEEDLFCYGSQCYAPTFWAMAVSVWIACGLVLWAWKGRNGWAQRGIVV
ncbi:major facilitator superfamily domain-containing protein [Cercophora newfieldiana]|uniref:Probable transporter MCH1 n=1 Tax=Cercophora newfieldiana TaxID=92897 RepID=A0AA39YEX5_9PEZI|nr:major facilitator superfamily domain-containing protein [Cercophora newfieldiana]